MRRWFGTKKEKPELKRGGWPLREAVNQALKDWKHAQHVISICENDNQIDDAIFYLQLTEKRYIFLLNQARFELEGQEA